MIGVTLRRNRTFLIALIFVGLVAYQLFHLFVQVERGSEVSQEMTEGVDSAGLMQRLQNLNERLRDAEFQSSARSQELVALKAQLSSVLSQNRRPNISQKLPRLSSEFVESNVLSVPGVFSFMPHLLNSGESLKPALHISKERIGVSLVFGIPTISRAQNTYLLDTLASLLDGMTQEDKDDSVIVVFIGETDLSYCQKIASSVKSRFGQELESGLLEIISPPAAFYPDLENIPLTFGDSKERVKWRTKQNLDFSFLMMYCQKKARFYVQLEDDIVASPSYANTIKTFALQQERNTWLMLEFSSLGFIGKLFRSTDLSYLVQFFLMFHKDKPVDWLLDHFLWVKVCNPEKDQKSCEREKQHLRIRFKPSLFQHVGKESSLKGKKQNLIDKDFKKAPLFQAHLNPKAVAEVSFEAYQKYTIDRAYAGETFFWAYPPDDGDVVRFLFQVPLEIEKFRLKSGNLDHPGDIITNATVEVLPYAALSTLESKPKLPSDASADAKLDFMKTQYPVSSYRRLGSFTVNGLAEAKVPDDIGKVFEFRIRFMGHKGSNWIILSDVSRHSLGAVMLKYKAHGALDLTCLYGEKLSQQPETPYSPRHPPTIRNISL